VTRRAALTPLDAMFLHVESERTPMHIASVGIFEAGPLYGADGNFRVDDIRHLIASRLDLVPKLRQRPAEGLFGEAPPVWLDDPDFEISRHVRVCRLPPPGTEVELRHLCAEFMAVPLEPTRPLWELTFVEGLSEERVALIEKLHHSMADGLAASELATVLLDLSPVPPQSEEVRPWRPESRPPPWRAAVDDLLRLGGVPVRVAKWYGQSILHPIRRTREMAELVGAVSTLATSKIIAPRSSLNEPITQARSVTFTRLPFEQVHDVARSFEVTINDVLLTLVAGGLRDLLMSRRELTQNGELQVLVPVGLVNAEGRGLANSVSALFVRLPIGMEDPVTVLKKVSDEMGKDKRRHQALAAATALRLLEPLPQNLLMAAAEFVHHQPFFNLIVTNVPGPPVALYALGSKLLEAFPLMPLAGNQSLAVAALSYEGQLNLGVLSDPATCPDVEVFCRGVRSELEALIAHSQTPCS
jgi:diacylglycerol O-acyltransferase / wax synthase